MMLGMRHDIIANLFGMVADEIKETDQEQQSPFKQMTLE
jgi:hypothetical protein